jgi:hypothetical protein
MTTAIAPAAPASRKVAADRGRCGRIAFETMRDYEAGDGTLLLGYAPMPDPTIRAGIAELSRLPGTRRR